MLEEILKNSFSLNITPSQYILLYLIDKADLESFKLLIATEDEEIIKRDFFELYRKDLIKNEINDIYNIDFEKLSCKVTNKHFLGNASQLDDFDNFFEEWINLFPHGVKSGGYYIRESTLSCKKKMKNFLKTFPYSKGEILEATKIYIERFRSSGFAYVQRSGYFISKDGHSNLEVECQNLKIDKNIQSNGTYDFNKQI